MIHWLLHYTGIDTQQSEFYDFWSGIGPVIFGQLPILGAVLLGYRHRNCYVPGCLRLGHTDPEHGHPACRKHHSQAHKLV
jgi:hypothetical protein